ncbi:MAG: hypothetical protein HQL13_05780 [Candidatus Omnitrophica bacterium]|nr:hypothetical protein [Candidatus Omnitrophota bacterium]
MMKLKPFSKNSESNRFHAQCLVLLKAVFGLCLLVLMFPAIEGCAPKKEAALSLSPGELQNKFELKCKKDYNLHVVTRLVGKTFWIYAPTDKNLFDFAAETPTPPDPMKKHAKYDLLYIHGEFTEKSFIFDYDVVPKIKSELQNEGIKNEASDYYNKLYNNLITVLTETMLDPKTPASFVVLTICDIKKGIESRYTFYLEDYRKASVEGLPYDEFNKRVLQEYKGNTNFIGDQLGQHLEYNDVIMPVFLTKQMVNRIRYKFTQSDFPPQQNYETAIIDTIADTTRYYHFKDFMTVRTNDIRNKKKMVFTPKQLSSFGEDKKAEKDSDGKLIHITFEDGKTTFKEQ